MSENQEIPQAEKLVYKAELSKCPPMLATQETYVPQISNCPPYYPPDHHNHPNNAHGHQHTHAYPEPEVIKCSF